MYFMTINKQLAFLQKQNKHQTEFDMEGRTN